MFTCIPVYLSIYQHRLLWRQLKTLISLVSFYPFPNSPATQLMLSKLLFMDYSTTKFINWLFPPHALRCLDNRVYAYSWFLIAVCHITMWQSHQLWLIAPTGLMIPLSGLSTFTASTQYLSWLYLTFACKTARPLQMVMFEKYTYGHRFFVFLNIQVMVLLSYLSIWWISLWDFLNLNILYYA